MHVCNLLEIPDKQQKEFSAEKAKFILLSLQWGQFRFPQQLTSTCQWRGALGGFRLAHSKKHKKIACVTRAWNHTSSKPVYQHVGHSMLSYGL